MSMIIDFVLPWVDNQDPESRNLALEFASDND